MEGGQAFHLDGLVLGHDLLQLAERVVAGVAVFDALAADRHRAATAAEDDARVRAGERVLADLVRLLHTLEQERVGLAMGGLEVGRHRGFEVREQVAVDGHQGPRLRQLAEGFQVRVNHGGHSFATPSPASTTVPSASTRR